MRHLSILVADDAEGIQQLLQELLKSAGHEVTCVSGGSEAIKLSKKQKFDLVITDNAPDPKVPIGAQLVPYNA